jgi:hypothetical protein
MSEPIHLSAESLVVVEPRFRYEKIVAQIVAARGEWIKIDPSQIGGAHPGVKQSVLLQAGRLRGMRFNTTFRVPGWLCARLVTNTEQAVAQ